tara:strand:+ start:1665 stop:1907 length:243 start_codon:yes stop_codon:yes gene_type:complete
MKSLRLYLNSMSRADQEEFAAKCKTSLGYLRKALSTRQKLGIELTSRLHKHSGGAVRATDIRPDVDWREFRSVVDPPEAA